MRYTADLFRLKKMMRKWRRAYLNYNIAKNSFELQSERCDSNTPSISDLLAYSKPKHSANFKKSMIECSYSPEVRKPEKQELDRGYKSMIYEALKENMQILNQQF